MENQNSLVASLKQKLPGRIFQLPSRGAFYKNDEISGTEGEVHVHPMSALAEISLKNPDLLFNGDAIKEVFKECVPEIKKPAEMYGRDIDTLLFYLRLVTYGPQFEIKVKHDCAEAKEHSYLVDLEELISKIRYLDPTVVEEQFQTTLPNGQLVVVRPMRYSHLIKLFQMNAGKQEFSPEDVKKNVVFHITGMIESVDGITDRKQIEDWVKQIPTPYYNRITELFEKTTEWGPEQTVKLKCKDCGEEMTVDLPLNPIAFFTE